MALHYKSLRIEASREVYEPAEDSLLLADSIVLKGGESVLDVGTGTGLLALVASEKASKVIGVDVNPEAVELAGRNALINGISNVEFRLGDLFSSVPEEFDLIVFNPPYLPVDARTVIERAWSGGERGLEVVERFLSEVKSHLKPGGRILMAVSSLNELTEVERMFKGHGLSFAVVAEKKVPFETLYAISSGALH